MTKSSQRNSLAAWSLLLSKKQVFLDNHLARVPIIPNEQGSMELQEEVLSSVGAQKVDTSGYQVSGLESIDFQWEVPDSNIDAFLRPGIDNPFSPAAFDSLGKGGSVENPI